MEVWATAFLLIMAMPSYLFAPTSSLPTTTDGAIDQVKKAADLDFNFIKNDLQDLQEMYTNFISTNNLNFTKKLSEAGNQTYTENIPKDPTGYNQLCLEGIYDDVEYMMKDLNMAVVVCGNLSQSQMKVNKNIAQFENITSSLEGFSQNLTILINICIDKFPKISWDRLECVFDQVDVVINEFNQVYNPFKMFNLNMSGHLMLLGVETSLCYQGALRKMAEISKAVLRDVDSCKIQT